MLSTTYRYTDFGETNLSGKIRLKVLKLFDEASQERLCTMQIYEKYTDVKKIKITFHFNYHLVMPRYILPESP